MEKINPFPLEFVESNKRSKYFKFLSYVFMLIFIFKPLYEFVDVFSKTFYNGWCCLLPCPGFIDGYFFL